MKESKLKHYKTISTTTKSWRLAPHTKEKGTAPMRRKTRLRLPTTPATSHVQEIWIPRTYMARRLSWMSKVPKRGMDHPVTIRNLNNTFKFTTGNSGRLTSSKLLSWPNSLLVRSSSLKDSNKLKIGSHLKLLLISKTFCSNKPVLWWARKSKKVKADKIMKVTIELALKSLMEESLQIILKLIQIRTSKTQRHWC